ncbi:PaaI family thioesterase [Vibrio harveyi]|uniref:PaaI family thioesterase n=1 Tax=Vibrio harveyi TaxID=669 RepID=UPI0023801B41|nr:PaaI family thioesterase [Vibrio harveyi]
MSHHNPKNHQQCAVCCQPFFNASDTVQFSQMPNGGVQCEIVPTEKVQGYQGVMQGGAICALHDTAMTHCLFAQKICAMTAKLKVRFIKPVPLNAIIRVEAHCVKSKRGMFLLQSEIYVGEQCYSKAEAKFMQHVVDAEY